MHRTVLSAVCLLLLICAPARADILDYMPAILAGGQTQGVPLADYYVFNSTTYDYTTEARSYSRPATLNGQQGYTEQMNFLYGGLFRSRFFRWVDGELMLYATRDTDGNTNVFDSPVSFGSHMIAGMTYTKNLTCKTYDYDDVQVGTGSSELTLKLTGPEEVTVEAGTYQAYRLDITDTWSSTVPGWGNGVINESLWLAKDVGIVKMTYEEDGGPQYTFRLEADTMDLTIADYFKLNTATHTFTETTRPWTLTSAHQDVTVAEAGTIDEMHYRLNGAFLNGRFFDYTPDGLLYSLGSRGDDWMELFFSPLYLGKECRLNVTYAYSKGEDGYSGSTGQGGHVGTGSENGTFRVTGPENVMGYSCYRATTTSTWTSDAWGESGSEEIIYWLNDQHGAIRLQLTDDTGTYTFERSDL